MALVVTDDKHYTVLADIIRETFRVEEKFTPEQMPGEITSALALKHDDGYATGYSEGEAVGKQKEWSEFWEAFQSNGNRKNYAFAFANVGWTQENLKPKYKIQPTNATQMFHQLGYTENSETIDLRPVSDKLDFSKATSMTMCFQNSKISYLGVIDLSSCVNVSTVFCNMYWLSSIEKLVVNENNVFDDYCFVNCAASSITFEGVIGSDLRMASVPLNKFSIESVINALSPTISGKTLTLRLASVQKAFETASGANDGNTSEEWLNLAATKSNWTITLV